jgi:type IV secretion system protein VirB10
VSDPARGLDRDGVRGERAEAAVDAARTVQSRVSSALAAGLMAALGLGALSWYYARTFTRPAHTRASAQPAANRAQGEMPLPPLGKIEPPRYAASAPSESSAGTQLAGSGETPLPEASESADARGAAGSQAVAAPAGTNSYRTPQDLARERRLGGGVFSRQRDSSAPTAIAAAGPAGTASSASAGIGVPGAVSGEGIESARTGERGDETLAARLRPVATPETLAQLLPTMRLLLPKGAFIDCTLETAIDSTLPGMTTCITAADTFGADGKVVLLERGTKLVGETRGQVQQGQARVFVLWSEARTPTGVVVALDSPGSDELGRSGLPGEVERHFWQRFGAAMLVSVVNGVVQAGVEASSRSGSAVIYAPSASQDVLTEVLKDTLRIAPTVVKRNGDRIQVLVARDVDFRPVYELRTRAGH